MLDTAHAGADMRRTVRRCAQVCYIAMAFDQGKPGRAAPTSLTPA